MWAVNLDYIYLLFISAAKHSTDNLLSLKAFSWDINSLEYICS